MAEYIEREAVALKVKRYLMPNVDVDGTVQVENAERYFLKLLEEAPTADVAEVVRCKDCVYFQPNFVLTNNGERRPYTEEEKQSELGMVSGDVGINCGSRCERHDYWEENQIPVWFSENDFCSYGVRKGEGE